MGMAVRSPGRKRLASRISFVRADAVDDGAAMPGQPRIAIEPVETPAQQVEPEMIARRPAQRAGNQDALPLQLPVLAITHIAM